MNPQTLREGARILSIVDDMIEELSAVALLPAYLNGLPPASRHALLAAFSTEDEAREVQQQLNDHYDLERRLEAAAGTGEMSAEDIAELHFSTRALVETLHSARWGTPALKLDPTHHASPNVHNFIQVMSIQRQLLQDRLHTTVEDDVAKFAILNDTVNRERTASADVQALNREFANEKESRRVEVDKRDAMIRKLKSEWQQVQETSVTEKQFFDKASLEVRGADQHRYASEKEALAAKVEQLYERLRRVQRECGTKEQEKRQHRTRNETAVKQAIDTYDSNMFQLTSDIERLDGENKDTERQLDQVQGELQELNAQADAYAAEMHLEQQRKEHVAEMKENLHNVARIIQACFRSHMVRVNMAMKGKKGKKGKKK